MSKGLRIMYNSRVKQIRYSKQEVAVRTPMHIFRGSLQTLIPLPDLRGAQTTCMSWQQWLWPYAILRRVGTFDGDRSQELILHVSYGLVLFEVKLYSAASWSFGSSAAQLQAFASKIYRSPERKARAQSACYDLQVMLCWQLFH